MSAAHSQRASLASVPHAGASLRWRVVSQTVILAAFTIAALTTLSFFAARSLLLQSVDARLSAFAAISEDALTGTLQRYRERTSLIAVPAYMDPILRSASPNDSLEALRAAVGDAGILSLTLYDADGRVRAHAGDAVEEQALSFAGQPSAVAVYNAERWERYDITLPIAVQESGESLLLVARYDAATIVQPLLPALTSLGKSARVAFVTATEEGLFIVRPTTEGVLRGVVVGTTTSDVLPVFYGSTQGQEGVARMRDEEGRDVLTAYRYLPMLGWGMVVQLDRDVALNGVRNLAVTHAIIGSLLLVLAAAIASYLAGQVTLPLRQLAEKVRRLRPGHWQVRRTVHTGDEVDVLDAVVVHLSSRLRGVYEHLEQTVNERTKELQQQSALDRAILSSIDYGVLTVNARGKVTGLNPAAERLLQLDLAAVKAKVGADVLQLCADDGASQRTEHPLLLCMRQKQVVRSSPTTNSCVRRADGSLLPVTYSAAPLRHDHGVFGAIIVFQDVTEARHLDDLKSEFISLASHQLRTPLSALRWYVELLGEEKGLTADQQAYVGEMSHSINRMVTLLASLLHAAKLEGGDVKPSLQQVDAGSLIRETAEDSKPLIVEAHMKLVLDLPEKPLLMRTDPTLVRIILQNLISNAVKYSPGGTKKNPKPLRISLQQSGAHSVLSVADEGVGIPVDEQQQIFSKFFRATNVRPLDTDGNGLGLHITHAIVERLGGTITFESTQQSGTTFVVKLPLAKTSRRAQSDAPVPTATKRVRKKKAPSKRSAH